MRTLTARPALRWLVPLAVLLLVLGSFLVGTRASASPALPDRDAKQLLVDLQTAKVDGLSGTVVETADLGIPAIPGASDGAAGKVTDLISGSHSFQVFYSGPDKARLAMSDQYAETDVITNGKDVWTYDSATKKATHRTMSADQRKAQAQQTPADVPKTPQDAAAMALKAVGKTTDVTTDSAVTVAGRPAYELVLTPQDTTSLIKQVRIAIDGEHHIPLRVQVFGSEVKPAVEVGYTSVTFAQPDERNFQAPNGVKPTEVAAPEHKAPTKAQKKDLKARQAKAEADTKVVGSGWTAVVVTKVPADAATSNETAKQFLGKLQTVPVAGGTGKVLDGTIVKAILTDDGRLAVGAVSTEVLQQALAR